MTAAQIDELVEPYEGEVLLADGFEEAFLGIAEQFTQPIAVYDHEMCIEVLVRQGMTEEDAEEFFSYNVQGAYCGPGTPAFLYRQRAAGVDFGK